MRVFLLFLTVCGGLLAPWPVMAQAPIPPASVVRFNTPTGAPAGAGKAAVAVTQRRTAARMPCSSATGVGGQPGTRASTGITFSTAPQLA